MALTFTADQVTREEDWRQTPQPDRDCHWWRIGLGNGRTGWAWVARSVPPPSEEWIAEELNRQAVLLGHALEGSSCRAGSISRWRRARISIGRP